MTDPAVPPPSTKPGYRTTEFWLKVAALLLTALFASGAIPTSGPAATITAIAATMLGALGYTVSRSFVKAAAILLVIMLGGGSQLGCTAAQRTATGHAVIDCTAANGAAIGDTATSMRGSCLTPAGATDWGCVKSKAIAAGLAIGGCAFLEVALAPPAAGKASAAAEVAPPVGGRVAFESYRASTAGGAAFRTAGGDR